MIRANLGNVSFAGMVPVIMSEITSIVICATEMLMENEGFSKEKAEERVRKSVDMAFKTEDELKTEAEEKMKQLPGELLETLAKAMKGGASK